MLRISTFKIQSKRVELPKGNLNLDSLLVSFNEMYRDYVIYYPGSIDKYITNIGDIELGFGPRYLLHKLLKEVRKANPDGTVDNGSVVVKTIPQLPEPLTRRLGQLNREACGEDFPTSNKSIPGSFGEPEHMSIDTDVAEKAERHTQETNNPDKKTIKVVIKDPNKLFE